MSGGAFHWLHFSVGYGWPGVVAWGHSWVLLLPHSGPPGWCSAPEATRTSLSGAKTGPLLGSVDGLLGRKTRPAAGSASCSWWVGGAVEREAYWRGRGLSFLDHD